MSRSELVLIEKAIRNRWPISDFKQRLILSMVKDAVDQSLSARDRARAAQILLSMESQNQTDEHTAALQSDRNRFLKVAQQLGIDADFRLVGQEPAGANHVGTDGPERRDEAAVERHRPEADDEEQSS